MGLRVKIGPVVEFKSEFDTIDGDHRVPHKLELVADRKTASELRALVRDGNDDQTYADLCGKVIKGWKSQDLVVDDETNQPAPFSPEALALLLDVPGLAIKVWADFTEACGPKGKRGN